MSSGLIATMGLPAQALANDGSSGQGSKASGVKVDNEFLAAPVSAAGAHQLSESPTAAARFNRSSFAAGPATAGADTTTARHVSRTLTRSSLTGTLSGIVSRARGSSVLAIAVRYLGIDYVYGGTTPGGGFDCSGYVKYVFGQLGIGLPRTADEQMNATTRISRSAAKPGDLVFFVSGGNAYHVGIYAGGGMMYDAPHTGAVVRKEAISSSNAVYGRVVG